MAKNKCENDVTLIFFEPYGVYKKLGHFFFHIYLITFIKKDTAVLLKAEKIEQVNKLNKKTMVLTFAKNILYVPTISLIKL